MYLHRAARAKMTPEEVIHNTKSAVRLRKKILETYNDFDKSITYLRSLIVKIVAGRDTLLKTEHIEEIITHLDHLYQTNFIKEKEMNPHLTWQEILETENSIITNA